MGTLKRIISPDTLIVVTFARAGLGHLRVANALMEALPDSASAVLLSTRDETSTFMHRLSSTNPAMRWIGERGQEGALERLFTRIYTRVLRRSARKLLPSLVSMLTPKNSKPRQVVFVCTHFGLAHQIGELKASLVEATEVKVRLVVVVTDDSPQKPWFVPEADLTIVPSKATASELQAQAKSSKTKAKYKIKAVHYPVSLKLAESLSKDKFEARRAQADPQSRSLVKISLPVSGAAVGLAFYENLVADLAERSPRYRFYIVSRISPHTSSFLDRMSTRAEAKIYQHEHDRLVVSKYIKMVQNTVLSLEVTKPSEQAFKALYTPSQKGGVILLFARPVGRQEWDNLAYLRRNRMIPSETEQKKLWHLALAQKPLEQSLKLKAKSWRGMMLPKGSVQSTLYIDWSLRESVFSEMMKYKGKEKSRGAKAVWRAVDKII